MPVSRCEENEPLTFLRNAKIGSVVEIEGDLVFIGVL